MYDDLFSEVGQQFFYYNRSIYCITHMTALMKY